MAAVPVQEFLKDCYDPHCAAIITLDGVKIVRDEIFTPPAPPGPVVSMDDFEPKRK